MSSATRFSESNSNLVLQLWETQRSSLTQINLDSNQSDSIDSALSHLVRRQEMLDARISRYSGSSSISNSSTEGSFVSSSQTTFIAETPSVPLVEFLENSTNRSFFSGIVNTNIESSSSSTPSVLISSPSESFMGEGNNLVENEERAHTFLNDIRSSLEFTLNRYSNLDTSILDSEQREHFSNVLQVDQIIHDGIPFLNSEQLDLNRLDALRELGSFRYLNPVEYIDIPRVNFGVMDLFGLEVPLLHIFNLFPMGTILSISSLLYRYTSVSPSAHLIVSRLLFRLRRLFFSFCNVRFWRHFNIKSLTSKIISVIQSIVKRRYLYQTNETIRAFRSLTLSSPQNLARAITTSSSSFRADLRDLNNRGSFQNFLSWIRNRNTSQMFVGSTVMVGFGVFARHLFTNPDIATRFFSFISSTIWRSEGGRITSTVSSNLPGNMVDLTTCLAYCFYCCFIYGSIL